MKFQRESFVRSPRDLMTNLDEIETKLQISL